VQNLRDESEVIIDPASGAIAKEMQTRYLHPQWIKSQQAEGYSGTLQVLKATQFLWGWQVTAPDTVREDQWQSMLDVYVNDQYGLGTRQWLEEDNQQALAQILERMIDAVRLDYWKPSEATRQELFAAYEQAKQASDLIESNRQVREFVSLQRQFDSPSKPDLMAAAADPVTESDSTADADSPPLPAESPTSQPTQFVQGQELRPVAASTTTANQTRWSGLMTIATLSLLVIAGGLQQHRRFTKTDVSHRLRK
jgi:cobaltochelatase CobN